MYTRSYQRPENKRELSSSEQPFVASPPHRVLSKSEIPEGYSGTSVLREGDSVGKVLGTLDKSVFSDAHVSPSQAQIHTKKFKVATKITPSLWQSGDEKNDTSSLEAQKEESYDSLAEEAVSNGGKARSVHTVCQKNAGFEAAESGGDCCERRDTDSQSVERDAERCGEQEERAGRHRKRGLFRQNIKKHCFECTPVASLKERAFSIEDLLLGGLILLMLNEGADDDIILMFGFLLFSSL